MPAAAVIPAPIAYTKVVAIKKLVVGSQAWAHGPPHGGHCVYFPILRFPVVQPMVLFIERFGWPEILL